MNVTDVPKLPAELQVRVVSMEETLEALLKISDEAECALAIEADRTAGAVLDEIEGYLGPIRKSAYAHHRLIVQTIDKAQGRLPELREQIMKQINEYRKEVKRKAIEAQNAAAVAAKKLRDDIAMRNALQLQAQGRTDEANKEIEKAAAAPTLFVAVAPAPSVVNDGTYEVTEWKFRITDESLIPDEYWLLSEKAVQGVVDSLKEKTNIPGIEVYPETSTRRKPRRR